MLKQLTAGLLVAGAALLGAADTATAQQTVNFNLGYDTLLGQDSRTGAGCGLCRENIDIFVADRRFLTFDVGEFNGVTVGGEWLIPIGQFIEAGAGVSFSQQTVHSVYTNYTNATGAEVEQELELRRVPFDFTVRVLPLRQTSPIQPYFGVGLSLINWRYQETGQYIDFSNGGRSIYCVGDGSGCDKPYDSDGTAKGPVFIGGIRFAGATFSAGGEVRYRDATGDLDEDFANVADKIDLGGWTYQATVGWRFGR